MLLASTHAEQSSLANYCKTGNLGPIKGINVKNIVQYRRLVFNNIIDTLETAYPITYKLLGEEKWLAAINDYFENCNIQNPQIWLMPEEFKDYLIESNSPLLKEYVFLKDLLAFEWIEVAVFMMPDISRKQKTEENTFLLNPEIDLIKVDYPVHLKNANLITEADKSDYFISMHRNPDTGSVQFTNLSIPFVEVLETMSDTPLTIIDIKAILGKYASQDVVEVVANQFIDQSLLTQLIY